jgi:hypothetical protein
MVISGPLVEVVVREAESVFPFPWTVLILPPEVVPVMVVVSTFPFPWVVPTPPGNTSAPEMVVESPSPFPWVVRIEPSKPPVTETELLCPSPWETVRAPATTEPVTVMVLSAFTEALGCERMILGAITSPTKIEAGAPASVVGLSCVTVRPAGFGESVMVDKLAVLAPAVLRPDWTAENWKAVMVFANSDSAPPACLVATVPAAIWNIEIEFPTPPGSVTRNDPNWVSLYRDTVDPPPVAVSMNVEAKAE